VRYSASLRVRGSVIYPTRCIPSDPSVLLLTLDILLKYARSIQRKRPVRSAFEPVKTLRAFLGGTADGVAGQ
jgi:hypothetical protein